MTCQIYGRLPLLGSSQLLGAARVTGTLVNGVPNASSQTKRSYAIQSVTDIKRGRGGRSSFSGLVTTVFGASGFLGRALVNKLGKIGSQVIVPYRGDPYDVRDLKLMGDLGQILFMPYHLEDEDSIRKALRHSNVVVNLIGKTHETKKFPFKKVHVEGAHRIARLAKEEGVETLVHVSALNCDANPEPQVILTGSKFLRTKYYGEVAVKEAFPNAIIFRPSDMWGQVDHFIFYYCSRYRRMRVDENVVTMPLWKKGKETVKQPVYAGDVAEGIIKAAQDPIYRGRTIEAIGPNRYQLDELIRWFYSCLRFDPEQVIVTDINLPFKLKVLFNQKIQPIYTPISMERVELEGHTDLLVGYPTLEDLGVNLTRLEDRIHWEVKPFRKYGYYWDALGEFPNPPDPPLSNDSPYLYR